MRSHIKNLGKLDKRLSTRDFAQAPTGEFLRSWREDLRQEAIERAPNWKGGIVNALRSSQDTAKFPLYARVFSDAPQARWSEYGTGALSEDPRSPKRAYQPPVEAVREWAEEKGIEPYILARGIFRAGGTKPTHFFSDAEQAADSRLNEKLVRFGRAIQREAGHER